jgi:drug/metabolite transporter (DMT)-like permease
MSKANPFVTQKSYEIDDDVLATRTDEDPQESTILEGLDELFHTMGYGTINLEDELASGEDSGVGVVEPVVPTGAPIVAVSNQTNDVVATGTTRSPAHSRIVSAPDHRRMGSDGASPGHRRLPSSGHHRRHRRNESIAEAFVEEVMELTEVFVDELEEADTTSSMFLDMTLTRGLSILPGDLVQAAEATAPVLETTTTTTIVGADSESQPLKATQEITTVIASIPFSAYLGLGSAVFALSSIGPLLQMQETVDPVMKIFWRMNATAMLLFPFAVRSLWNDGGFPKLTVLQMISFVFTAASYATMCTAFVIALKYTAVGNAVILANSQALILLVAKLFVGERVLMLEAGGALVAFLGAALCSKDSSEAGASSESGKTVVGDLIAMIAAVAGVWYLVMAKTIRPYVSLYLFMFLIMAMGSSLVWVYMAFRGIEYSLDRDVHHGLWGWMNLQSDRLPLEMTMVLFCNFCGTIGKNTRRRSALLFLIVKEYVRSLTHVLSC